MHFMKSLLSSPNLIESLTVSVENNFKAYESFIAPIELLSEITFPILYLFILWANTSIFDKTSKLILPLKKDERNNFIECKKSDIGI